jgi:polyisoprenoid-binding protein YceI
MSTTARYETDPTHTFVTFEVKHFATSTVRVRLDDVTGSVELGADGQPGHADITIDMASVDSGTDAFDAHLKGDEFFDVETHPTAQFKSDDFQWQGERLAAVAGHLTLCGQTYPVTLTCHNFNRYDSPILEAPVVGGDFETTIQRSQWGVNWGLEMGIPDEVRLVIQIEAAQTES